MAAKGETECGIGIPNYLQQGIKALAVPGGPDPSGHTYHNIQIGGHARVMLGNSIGPASDDRVFRETQHREAFLHWLSPVTQWDRYDEVKRRTEGTGKWLFAEPKFVQWSESKEPSLLWLRGKTMVLEHLSRIDEINGSEPVAFYFCDRTSRPHEILDEASIFRTVLKQLLRRSDARLPSELVKNYEDRMSDGKSDGELCRVLILDLIQRGNSATLVIDALDECSQAVRTALLQRLILPLLRLKQAKVKVFISSRPGPLFERYQGFDVLEPSKNVYLIEVENEHDITLFINEQMEKVLDPGYFDKTYELIKARAIEKLRQRADGMYVTCFGSVFSLAYKNRFRWAQLALEQVQRSPERVLEIVDILPLDLENAYDAVFKSIPDHDRDIVSTALLLIAYGFCSLLVDELVEAVFDTGFHEPQSHLRLRLLRGCSQFVLHDLKTDQLRLAHLSVREFLEDHTGFPKGDRAHVMIANLCMKVLTPFFDAQAPRNRRVWDLGHFICYAITMMPFHIKAAQDCNNEIALWKLYMESSTPDRGQDDHLRDWLDMIVQRSSSDSDHSELRHSPKTKDYAKPFHNHLETLNRKYRLTPLDSMFYFGLKDLISDVARSPAGEWNFEDSAYETRLRWYCTWTVDSLDRARDKTPSPVFKAILDLPYAVEYAIESGNPALVLELLSSGARCEPRTGSRLPPLHMATVRRDIQSIKALLEHGANVRTLDFNGWTALHHDVWHQGHKGIAITKLLLKHGAEVDQVENRYGLTPFLLALSASFPPSKELLTYLIEMGADIKALDSSSNTALHVALSTILPPNIENFKLLLEHGANPNQLNAFDTTPLHLVLMRGVRQAFDLILERGSDIFVMAKSRVTYLHQTAQWLRPSQGSHADLVQELVYRGIDVNACTDSGETALHWATRGPKIERPDLTQSRQALENMQILLKLGADVHLKNSNGQTALDYAVDLGLREVVAMLSWYTNRRKSIFGPFDYVPYWYERHRRLEEGGSHKEDQL